METYTQLALEQPGLNCMDLLLYVDFFFNKFITILHCPQLAESVAGPRTNPLWIPRENSKSFSVPCKTENSALYVYTRGEPLNMKILSMRNYINKKKTFWDIVTLTHFRENWGLERLATKLKTVPLISSRAGLEIQNVWPLAQCSFYRTYFLWA